MNVFVGCSSREGRNNECYNKIAEDPKFGEYYLLGTLLSSMLVIAVYMLILN